MVTLYALYLNCADTLSEHGIENARFEARELTRFAFGYSLEEFLREKQRIVEETALDNLVCRRVQGEPLAHIIGEWDFYGLTLTVTPDVLVPRSDTEVLVDTALKLPGTRFLDLCTGSGCVGIALAHERSELFGVLLDNSEAALEIAWKNVKQHRLESQLSAVLGDVCHAPEKELGKFDFIVSNPPYITLQEMQELDVSVGFFEPTAALYGGVDGFTFYDAILNRWLETLNPGGAIAFECGYRQARDLAERMQGVGLSNIEIIADTAGIERVVLGFRN
ncbi:MAG: peptide chain release factor N(5)-glutamine methyltransferase [Oscillospiraceae bacterium]|nr:peptide chain release factor N(5)-glutamine methyltransferase [Oscillospiraceae bacterium]